MSQPPDIDSCTLPDPPGTNNPENQEPYIYTSVRYDPIFKDSPQNTASSFNIPCPFYMLEHHWTRLQVAHWSAQFWTHNNGDAVSTHKPPSRPADFLHGLLSAVKHWQRAHPKEAEWAEALRVRWRTYASGRIATEIWQIPRKPLGNFFPASFDLPKDAPATEWSVVMDNQPTVATEATMFKIWDRTPQSRARADAGILNLGTTREVLLFNPENEILDGSNSTPYFRRGGKWVTPISSSGGLQGTTRRWALENGLCTEAVISTESFVDGEVVWFSNAVKGYFWAIYRAEREKEVNGAEKKAVDSEAQMRFIRRQLS